MIWVNILFFTAVTFGLIWLWSLVCQEVFKESTCFLGRPYPMELSS